LLFVQGDDGAACPPRAEPMLKDFDLNALSLSFFAFSASLASASAAA
jgi:hypothetical protein